jgi:ubiquinone/menaquinone biosynthesis C-methylase UbiE
VARSEVAGEPALTCRRCCAVYPVIQGIPDFIREDLSLSEVPLVRWAEGHYNRLAPHYERLRYPWRLLLHGGWGAPSLADLVRLAAGLLPGSQACTLDVACGPGTLGRRLAALTGSQVYGCDLSWGMLRQGADYVRSGRIPNVYFARARVECLPFQPGSFDSAVCGAALHLFADPGQALSEIGRALKPGGGLAVQTMSAEPAGIFRLASLRQAARSRGSHLFSLPELAGLLEAAGFTDFQPRILGSIILFTARKRPETWS